MADVPLADPSAAASPGLADPALAAAPALRRTALFEAARAAGGRLVPFAGWEMAVQFAGLVAEHQAVRSGCGLFDISHMGVLTPAGRMAPRMPSRPWCPPTCSASAPVRPATRCCSTKRAASCDDLIVYDQGRVAAEESAAGDETDGLLLVINAACAEADTAWIRGPAGAQGHRSQRPQGGGRLAGPPGPRCGEPAGSPEWCLT